jgi:hypothetical protein
MEKFINTLLKLVTKLYHTKKISKDTHDLFMVEIGSFLHEKKKNKN